MWGPDPLLLRKKQDVGGSSPIIWHCARDRVCGKSVSQPFLHTTYYVHIFSFAQGVVVPKLSSGSLSDEIAWFVAVYSVYP